MKYSHHIVSQLTGLLVFALACMPIPSAYADITSTNYAIAGQLTAGTGSATSTNYDIDQGSLVGLSQGMLSSTNYQLGSGAEAASATAIAKIDSISPANFPKFFSDSTSDFTVTATDPDSDSLQYKAYQDTTLKDGPQASNALSWSLSDSDIGRHDAELQVVDPDGTISQTEAMFVVRRPVK